MEAPDFWDNAEASQMKMKQLKSLKDDIETYHNLETQMEDMETMIEMGYEENDPEIVPEIQEMLDEFQASFDSIRVKTLLSGEYDGENADHQAERRSRRNRGLRLVRNALSYVQQMARRRALRWRSWITLTVMRPV